MASRIKAIKTPQASIQTQRTADIRDIIEFMQRRTGLGEGEIWQVQLTSTETQIIRHSCVLYLYLACHNSRKRWAASFGRRSRVKTPLWFNAPTRVTP